MDKTLNDRIEEIFRGIVFVLFSFVASLFILIINPRRGHILLIKRAHHRRTIQVRPYAFVFLAFLIVFFSPVIFDSIAPPSVSSSEYQVHDSDFPEAGVLGRAYDATARRIETKSASAFFLAAVTGVALFHLGATVSGVCLMRRRARREIWRDSLFYVGGMQISLLLLALFLDRFGWPSRTEIGFFLDFITAPLTLIYEWGEVRPYPRYIDVLSTILLVILLLAPLGMSVRYMVRLDRRFWMTWPPQSRPRGMVLAFIVIISDAIMLSSFGLAAYVADETQPHDKPTYPFQMQYAECSLQRESNSDVITGYVTVRAALANAWNFEDGDFELIVAAARIKSDPLPRARSFRVERSDRILAPTKIRALAFSAVSPSLGSPPFLLQAGQAALFRVRALVPKEITSFLSTHPHDQRCTISYTQDYPIGAIGIISTSVVP